MLHENQRGWTSKRKWLTAYDKKTLPWLCIHETNHEAAVLLPTKPQNMVKNISQCKHLQTSHWKSDFTSDLQHTSKQYTTKFFKNEPLSVHYCNSPRTDDNVRGWSILQPCLGLLHEPACKIHELWDSDSRCKKKRPLDVTEKETTRVCTYG